MPCPTPGYTLVACKDREGVRSTHRTVRCATLRECRPRSRNPLLCPQTPPSPPRAPPRDSVRVRRTRSSSARLTSPFAPRMAVRAASTAKPARTKASIAPSASSFPAASSPPLPFVFPFASGRNAAGSSFLSAFNINQSIARAIARRFCSLNPSHASRSHPPLAASPRARVQSIPH